VEFWFVRLIVDLTGVVEPPSSVASGLHADCRHSSLCSNVVDSSMVLVDELHFINSSPSVRLTYARRTRSPFKPVSLELALTCSTTPRQLALDTISSSFRASSRNSKRRVKTKLAARYFPSARQIAWIVKSLPIPRIRVSC
jgi:hypothetical protein